jgi:large subunit ribosomal protein L15
MLFNDGDTVDIGVLTERRIIRKPLCGLKVLANGEITKKLNIAAVKFSEAAKAKIESAGGKAEVI